MPPRRAGAWRVCLARHRPLSSTEVISDRFSPLGKGDSPSADEDPLFSQAEAGYFRIPNASLRLPPPACTSENHSGSTPSTTSCLPSPRYAGRTDGADQLLDDLSWPPGRRRTNPPARRRRPDGEVLPAQGVEGAGIACIRNGCRICSAAFARCPDPIGRVDDQLAVEGCGVLGEELVRVRRRRPAARAAPPRRRRAPRPGRSPARRPHRPRQLRRPRRARQRRRGPRRRPVHDGNPV